MEEEIELGVQATPGVVVSVVTGDGVGGEAGGESEQHASRRVRIVSAARSALLVRLREEVGECGV